MVRGTAWKMEKKGILYPAEDIRGWLREADILHISNEIPFDPDCPPPDPKYAGLIFCSNPRYIALMEDIGTDVVELTGDHFADYGPEATLFTLDLYRQEGWPYYGGGANAEEARQPVLFEHNGNKIAFLGCNAKGGGYATASDTVPGAWECDFDLMRQEVQRLRADGYLPIVTFQHQESENLERYRVRPEYRPDFQSMAEAGAVIVSGSQAHQPLNFEFVGRWVDPLRPRQPVFRPVPVLLSSHHHRSRFSRPACVLRWALPGCGTAHHPVYRPGPLTPDNTRRTPGSITGRF